MQYTKKSFSDKTFTDVIVCRKFAWRSFNILKEISVHVMKAIAQHGVVNQLMLQAGIIGTA